MIYFSEKYIEVPINNLLLLQILRQIQAGLD